MRRPCASWSAPIRLRSLGREARRRGSPAVRRHQRPARRTRHALLAERPRRRERLCPARRGDRPRRPAAVPRLGDGGRGRGARARRTRRHAVALDRRAVPDLLPGPRAARGGVLGLDAAGRARGGDRQPAGAGRDPRAAGGEGEAPRVRVVCGLQARRHDGQDPRRRGKRCCAASGTRRASARRAMRRRWRRLQPARATTRRSPPPTGATMPRSGGRPSSRSTRGRSRASSSSTG